MTPFARKVVEVVQAIPSGEQLSYGQVALRAGKPRAARAVVAVLKLAKLPWWRVIRSDGTLAGAVADPQANLLRAEGVTVVGRKIVKPRRRR